MVQDIIEMIEARDVILALFGVLLGLIGFSVAMIRSENAERAKVDRDRLNEHIQDDIRKFQEVTRDIGEAFSKINDERADRLKGENEMLKLQLSNQGVVMNMLAGIANRANGNNVNHGGTGGP